MGAPSVSILLRSFNEAWALRDTIAALKAQTFRDWELIAFDSGSTDGSVDLIRRFGPARFIQLQPHEYRPGRVLNQGMELCRHDRMICLNADATPQSSEWLEPLVRALDDPRTAAVFGRQVPRPNCAAAFARDYDRCYGPNRESGRWPHFFSMVSSGLRKDVWSRRGFDESMQYSEDEEYTRWCRSEGYQIRYIPDSVVMHSHNYSPAQAYRRSFGEAWATAGMERPGARANGGAVALGWARDLLGDLRFCARTGRLREWAAAARLRWNQRLGRRDGFRAGWRMHAIDQVL